VVFPPESPPHDSQETITTSSKYKAFTALDPFFDVVQKV